jgi:DNA repair protein SbcD/Mre11
MRGLPAREYAATELLRDATQRAFRDVIDFCIAEGVELLLLAGDLFDGDWRCHSSWLFFSGQLRRLEGAGVRVVLVRGNHDAASVLTQRVSLPANVHDLSTRRPETVVFDDLRVAVHGQGFARREEKRDLAAEYPPPIPGHLNIGLLHTALAGHAAHETYAPCSVATLVGKGYDYWALGHVHDHVVVNESPWVVFSGNLQGRHVRETGPKGVVVIDVVGTQITSVQHVAFDVVRWASCDVDVTGATTESAILERLESTLDAAVEAADGRPLAARVSFVGATEMHRDLSASRDRWADEVQSRATGLGDVWIERVKVKTHSLISLDEVRQREDVLGRLVRAVDDLRGDSEAQSELFASLGPLERKLDQTRGLRAADVGLEPSMVAGLLDEVQQLLVSRLLEHETDDTEVSS